MSELSNLSLVGQFSRTCFKIPNQALVCTKWSYSLQQQWSCQGFTIVSVIAGERVFFLSPSTVRSQPSSQVFSENSSPRFRQSTNYALGMEVHFNGAPKALRFVFSFSLLPRHSNLFSWQILAMLPGWSKRTMEVLSSRDLMFQRFCQSLSLDQSFCFQ